MTAAETEKIAQNSKSGRRRGRSMKKQGKARIALGVIKKDKRNDKLATMGLFSSQSKIDRRKKQTCGVYTSA
ncbi:MAG: hypothetical protein PHQ35_05855 [Phycisphaerae bacterium]|nr:hypothetical protein [Phycisphaerae bacterium]